MQISPQLKKYAPFSGYESEINSHMLIFISIINVYFPHHTLDSFN